MELLTTFGDTRRSRRRQAYRGTTLIAGLSLLVVLGAGGAYEIGRSQNRFEIARLEADLGAQQELNRLLSERAASAEQQAEAAITRSARLQQALNTNTPRGEVRELTALVEQRLGEGLPAERLKFLLREAQAERRCGKDVDAKRLQVHTSAATAVPQVLSFANNRITVSAEGSPIRLGNGQTEASFDAKQPVTLRFLKIGREVSIAAGALPLSHALVLGNEEYLFAVRPSDRPGLIELVAQACAYP